MVDSALRMLASYMCLNGTGISGGYIIPHLTALHLIYSGSQSHTTRRGRDSCSLRYAPVANVCDLLLFLDENRVIPEFRHF